MRQICYYCGLLFGIKEPLDLDEETHGICPWCLPDILKNIDIELAQIEESQTIPEGSYVSPFHSRLRESGGEATVSPIKDTLQD